MHGLAPQREQRAQSSQPQPSKVGNIERIDPTAAQANENLVAGQGGVKLDPQTQQQRAKSSGINVVRRSANTTAANAAADSTTPSPRFNGAPPPQP